MKALAAAALALALSACTTTAQVGRTDFTPPQGEYRVIVMRPDIQVSLLTASGLLEPRQDWTDQARIHVLASLQKEQERRGGAAKIAKSYEEAGGDLAQVTELFKLHEAVGSSIQIHNYAPAQALPTKKGHFDWTLGESAVHYGRSTGYDYALFLRASDSFSSGGRVALQAMGFLGCAVGVCVIPGGGTQTAFATLVDLKSGDVVWFNFLQSMTGDIRTPEGADAMVTGLMASLKTGEAVTKP